MLYGILGVLGIRELASWYSSPQGSDPGGPVMRSEDVSKMWERIFVLFYGYQCGDFLVVGPRVLRFRVLGFGFDRGFR